MDIFFYVFIIYNILEIALDVFILKKFYKNIGLIDLIKIRGEFIGKKVV